MHLSTDVEVSPRRGSKRAGRPPSYGRFLQADPLGYDGDGPNLYSYVLNDPVNFTDTLGLSGGAQQSPAEGPDWTSRDCTGTRLCWLGTASPVTESPGPTAGVSKNPLGGGAGATVGDGYMPSAGEIVVTAAYAGFGYDPGQPLLGTSGTVSNNAALNEIVVTAFKTGRLAGIKIDWNLRYPFEQRWVVYPGLDIDYLGIAGRAMRDGTGMNRARVRADAVAFIHTHPPIWAEATPGPEDWVNAIPVYGITDRGVWVIVPGSHVLKWLP